MALTKEDLQAISELMDQKLGQKLAPIQADIAGMKTDIAELKESVEEIRDSTNYLADWVGNLEASFKKHEITGKG